VPLIILGADSNKRRMLEPLLGALSSPLQSRRYKTSRATTTAGVGSSRLAAFVPSSKYPDHARKYKGFSVTAHYRRPTTPQAEGVKGSVTEVLQGKCPRRGI